MKHIIKPATCLLLLSLTLTKLFAHGGEEHGGGGETKTTSSVNQKYFSVEVNSDVYELLLRYEPIHPNENATLSLFVSEYATNKPVDSATFQISCLEDDNIKFETAQTGKGAYSVSTKFPENKVYSLAVNVNSLLGPDLLLIQQIEAGKELPKAETAKAETSFLTKNIALVFAIGLAAGLLLMFIGTKFFGRKATALLIAFCLLPVANWRTATAHEGHDEGGKKNANLLSSAFRVPKETQFLFDVLTLPVEKNDFTESTKLLATIIPASNGQAVITSPQNGRIVSLSAKVGQKVTAGQLLAVIEQNIDAGAQVSLLAEKNNIEAEYEAAKKEYDRLKSIEDIVAKKDIAEAEARFRKAEENKKLFNSTQGKIIELRSPINGIVDNFSFTIGSTVNANETVFTVTNLSKVYLEAQAYNKDAGKINAGSVFKVESPGDTRKTGEARLLSSAQIINPSNQSQRVLFEMDNPNGEFKIGEFVNLRVFTSESSREVAVPNSAISELSGLPVVFIKDRAEQFSVSYVSLGSNNGTFTVIEKGVEEDERVVVNASYEMKMIYLNQ